WGTAPARAAGACARDGARAHAARRAHRGHRLRDRAQPVRSAAPAQPGARSRDPDGHASRARDRRPQRRDHLGVGRARAPRGGMSDFFSPDFLFRNAILGGLDIALLCSVVGVYLVLRRLVLIGVALPQASAAGVAAVFLATGHGQGEGHGTHRLALLGSLVTTLAALAGLLAAPPP